MHRRAAVLLHGFWLGLCHATVYGPLVHRMPLLDFSSVRSVLHQSSKVEGMRVLMPGVCPGPVVVTHLYSPILRRQRMVQLLFEKSDVPAVHFGLPAALGTVDTGLSHGIAVQWIAVNMPVTHLHDAWDWDVAHSVPRTVTGGRYSMHCLAQVLAVRGFPFSTAAECGIAHDINEELGYGYAEMKYVRQQDDICIPQAYKLPDGTLEIGSERFCCPEALLRPQLFEIDSGGFAGTIVSCNKKHSLTAFRSHQKSPDVILCGGRSLCTGLEEWGKRCPLASR